MHLTSAAFTFLAASAALTIATVRGQVAITTTAITTTNGDDDDNGECKNEVGSTVTAVFDSPNDPPICSSPTCRTFSGRESSTCPVQGGYVLTFVLGLNRTVTVSTCPDRMQPVLTFDLVGDTSPFTDEERTFFERTADKILMQTNADLNNRYSLDAQAIHAASILADWPVALPVSYAYSGARRKVRRLQEDDGSGGGSGEEQLFTTTSIELDEGGGADGTGENGEGGPIPVTFDSEPVAVAIDSEPIALDTTSIEVDENVDPNVTDLIVTTSILTPVSAEDGVEMVTTAFTPPLLSTYISLCSELSTGAWMPSTYADTYGRLGLEPSCSSSNEGMYVSSSESTSPPWPCVEPPIAPAASGSEVWMYGNCFGRCGVGCGTYFSQFTIHCLNLDFCRRLASTPQSDCHTEFLDAIDDWMWSGNCDETTGEEKPPRGDDYYNGETCEPTSEPVTNTVETATPTSSPESDPPTASPATDSPTAVPTTRPSRMPQVNPVTEYPTTSPESGAPTSMPTGSPVTDSSTASPVTDSPTASPVTAPTLAPFPDKVSPVIQSTPSPTSSPQDDNNGCLCHLQGQGQAINFIVQCLPQQATDARLRNHECDYIISDDCPCTEEGLQRSDANGDPACTQDRCPAYGRNSGTEADIVPNDNDNEEEEEEDCDGVALCQVSKSGNALSIDPICIPSDQVSARLASRPCDFYINGQESGRTPPNDCVCSEVDTLEKLQACVDATTCPDPANVDENGALPPPGDAASSTTTETTYDICHISSQRTGQTLTVRAVTRRGLNENQWNNNRTKHPCDWIVTDECHCGNRFEEVFDQCATNPDCPGLRSGRIGEDGTILPEP